MVQLTYSKTLDLQYNEGHFVFGRGQTISAGSHKMPFLAWRGARMAAGASGAAACKNHVSARCIHDSGAQLPLGGWSK